VSINYLKFQMENKKGEGKMLENVLWLPILFVIHDFEEIILVPRWVKRNFTVLSKKKRPLFAATTDSSALAIGVLEELILLLLISVMSMKNPNNVIYFSVLIGYTIHLFAHIIFCFQYKTYVPGAITAIIQLPFLILWIIRTYNSMTINNFILLFTCIIVFILLVANVLFLHQLIKKILKQNIL